MKTIKAYRVTQTLFNVMLNTMVAFGLITITALILLASHVFVPPTIGAVSVIGFVFTLVLTGLSLAFYLLVGFENKILFMFNAFTKKPILAGVSLAVLVNLIFLLIH